MNRINIIINNFYKLADRISGGLADNKKPENFNQVELQRGILAEMVHTSDREIAKELAMDNLSQDPDYYKKLNQKFLNPRK